MTTDLYAPKARKPWGHTIRRALGFDPSRPRIGSGGETLSVTGTGAAVNDTPLPATYVGDYEWACVQLAGPFVATVSWEQSNDGVTWYQLLMAPVNSASPIGSFQGSTVGIYAGPVAAKFFRARITAYTSGAVTANAFFGGLAGFAHVPVTAQNNAVASAVNTAGDGLSNQPALATWGQQAVYNGTSWDRQRGNVELSVFTLGSRSSNVATGDMTNVNGRGMILTLDVTAAGTGTLTATVQGKSSLAAKYYPLLTTAALPAAVATYQFRIYPGLTPVANLTVSDVLPRLWRFTTAGDGSNWTYTLDANYIL